MANTPAKFLKDVAGQVYAVVVDGVVYGIAGADGQAEAERKAAESERVTAEEARAAAESARVSAENQREIDQAKNNADQAANNQAAQGLIAVLLTDGQYDPATREPTVTGEVGKMYMVPSGLSGSENRYYEWMVLNGEWERVGTTDAAMEPLTTDEVDTVAGGGTVTNNKVLTGTGLTYMWGKLKAAFSAIGHKHSAADVTSGALPIEHGGTGATTAAGARNALGLGDTTGALPVANGGTGAVTAAEALAALGVTVGEADAPETGAPGSVYIKML